MRVSVQGSLYYDDDITPYVRSVYRTFYLIMMTAMNHNFGQYIENKNSLRRKNYIDIL